MDEDISIINNETRKEKIINFFINNKKKLISFLVFILLIILAFFSYQIYLTGHKESLANKYNLAVTNYEDGDKTKIETAMKEIINDKDKTYSPLALYFLIDKEISVPKEEINKYFDVLINEVNLDKEIKYLIIYKKGLFNADFETENNLIAILKPVINSDSVWKSHALYLMAEYLFDKNQKQKAKEFYNQILSYKKSNNKIVQETQKRLRRDFSE